MFKVRTLVKIIQSSEVAYVVPELGEVVYVVNTAALYVGNGKNAVSELSPISGGGSNNLNEIDGGNAFADTSVEVSGGNAFG